jgi:predicted RNase H-like HicB family nuclease
MRRGVKAEPMLRYIVFSDNGFWVAQGLEADICAQGKTAAEACERFEATARAEAFEANEEGRTLFDIGPGPDRFFTMWNQCDDGRRQLNVA